MSDRIDAALAEARRHGESAVQLAAMVHGEPREQAWTGSARPDRDQPVDASTLFPVFSVSKAFTAVAVHVLAENGLVDYDAPLSRYWPEYAQNGKDGITVRHVLIHRAGVPQMPQGMTVERLVDWEWMTAALEREAPLCAPGTRNTYMGYTYGFLLGELVRRADPAHRPFGRFLQEEVCAPLGIDEFWIGLPPSELGRVATLFYPSPAPLSSPDSVHGRSAPAAVGFFPDVYNLPAVQTACIPGSNGIGSARSVVRLFAMLAGRGELDGTRLLSEERVMGFLEPRPGGDDDDLTFGSPMPIGMGGMLLNPVGYVRTVPGARVLAQFGAGGTLGYADLDSGLSFAICHNRMFAKPALGTVAAPFEQLGEALLGLVHESSGHAGRVRGAATTTAS